jgi:riboflavin biosynthesis pyrimidine reductase
MDCLPILCQSQSVHVLEQLAQQNINSVLLESGPKLIGAMVEAGLVDEFILYTAPLLMGSNATSMIQLLVSDAQYQVPCKRQLSHSHLRGYFYWLTMRCSF